MSEKENEKTQIGFSIPWEKAMKIYNGEEAPREEEKKKEDFKGLTLEEKLECAEMYGKELYLKHRRVRNDPDVSWDEVYSKEEDNIMNYIEKLNSDVESDQVILAIRNGFDSILEKEKKSSNGIIQEIKNFFS